MKTRMIIIAAVNLLLISSCGKNEDQYDTQLPNLTTIGAISNDLSDNKRVADSAVVGSGNIEISLTWDSSADIDLYVQDPMGEWIWHKHKKSQSNGLLNIDDRNGSGPETVVWKNNQFPTGNYIVYVKHYGGGLANYSVSVQVCGKTKLYQGGIKKGDAKFITEFSEKFIEEQNNVIENDELPSLQKN